MSELGIFRGPLMPGCERQQRRGHDDGERRLIAKIDLLACSIGRSPGLVPPRTSQHRCPRGESRLPGLAAATNAANHGATVAELEAIFGWAGGQMASLYTRSANRRALSARAINKLLGIETEKSIPAPDRRCGRQSEKPRHFRADFLEVVRSEGLEPPRCYSLPPQGSASTNSATSAWEIGAELAPDPIKTGSTAPM